MIAELAGQLYNLIDRVLAVIKQGKFATTELVSDLEKVRAAWCYRRDDGID